MRTQFIHEEGRHWSDYAESLEQAYDLMPWAAIVVEVEGGYLGFQSVDEYKTWCNQG